MSPLAFAEIRCEHSKRRCDDKVVMSASRLQTEPALLARREAWSAVMRSCAVTVAENAPDLGAVVFAGALLRDAMVLDTVFLAAAGFSFLEPGLFFAAGRPRALIPRPDLEKLFFGNLAINDSFGAGTPAQQT